MHKLTILLLMAITISSCINEDEQKGINAVQHIVNANTVAIGSGTTVDTKKGKLSFKFLTLKSGDILDNPEISNESISSLSALTFYKNISSATIEGKDGIKIILERNINANLSRVESFYYIDTLEMVNKTSDDCKKLCKAFVSKNYLELYNLLFDVTKDYSFSDFEADMQKVDNKFGSSKSYLISGFKTKITTNKDGHTFPVVHYWINLERDSMNNKLDIEYSLDPTIKGVVSFEL